MAPRAAETAESRVMFSSRGAAYMAATDATETIDFAPLGAGAKVVRIDATTLKLWNTVESPRALGAPAGSVPAGYVLLRSDEQPNGTFVMVTEGRLVSMSGGGVEHNLKGDKAAGWYSKVPQVTATQLQLISQMLDVDARHALLVCFGACAPDVNQHRQRDPRTPRFAAVARETLDRAAGFYPELSLSQVEAVLCLAFGQDLKARDSVEAGRHGVFRVLAGRAAPATGASDRDVLASFGGGSTTVLLGGQELELAPRRVAAVRVRFAAGDSEVTRRLKGMRVFERVWECFAGGDGSSLSRLAREVGVLANLLEFVLPRTIAPHQLIPLIDDFSALLFMTIRETVRCVLQGMAPTRRVVWPSDLVTDAQRRDSEAWRRLRARHCTVSPPQSGASFGGGVWAGREGGGGGGGGGKPRANLAGWGKPFDANKAAARAAGLTKAHRGKPGYPAVGQCVATGITVSGRVVCSRGMHWRAVANQSEGLKMPHRTTTGPPPYTERSGMAYCGYDACTLSHAVVPDAARRAAHKGWFARLSTDG
jgi:hypothetical protein